MADAEMVARLKRGASQWNEWRSQISKAQPDISVDLSDANLSKMQIRGADLSGVRLQRANLTRANLSKAKLIDADLSQANLSSAKLSQTYLIEANLTKCSLQYADLSKAILVKANLSMADLTGAKLSNAILHKANLTETNFTDADLQKADLTGAILDRTDFTRAIWITTNLQGTDQSKAHLSKAVFEIDFPQFAPELASRNEYAFGPFQGDEEEDFVRIPIFYGTDRKRAKPNHHPSSFYSAARGELELGICGVSIPRDHTKGELESPSVWKLEFRENPSKHIILQSVEPLDAEEFVARLRRHAALSKRGDAFIFVHGYNVTFEDAARRTAQMAYDLEFDGAPIMYSWPSQGRTSQYVIDETNVEWTVPHLVQFLTLIATKPEIKTIHLIGHSMGNRALGAALKELLSYQSQIPMPRFRQLVLTAPDIDAGVFERVAKTLGPTSERITLYASSKDKALAVSKKFHGYQRAGDTDPEIVVISGIDSIDASSVDTSLLGHSYFSGNRSVLSDLYYLLRHGKPPEERFGLIEKVLRGLKFWAFHP